MSSNINVNPTADKRFNTKARLIILVVEVTFILAPCNGILGIINKREKDSVSRVNIPQSKVNQLSRRKLRVKNTFFKA